MAGAGRYSPDRVETTGSIGLSGDCSYYVLIEWPGERQAAALMSGGDWLF